MRQFVFSPFHTGRTISVPITSFFLGGGGFASRLDGDGDVLDPLIVVTRTLLAPKSELGLCPSRGTRV